MSASGSFNTAGEPGGNATARLVQLLEDHFSAESFKENGVMHYAVCGRGLPLKKQDELFCHALRLHNDPLNKKEDSLPFRAQYDGRELTIPSNTVAAMNATDAAALLEHLQVVVQWQDRVSNSCDKLYRPDIILRPFLLNFEGREELAFQAPGSGGFSDKCVESLNSYIAAAAKVSGADAVFFRKEIIDGAEQAVLCIREADVQRIPGKFWSRSRILGVIIEDATREMKAQFLRGSVPPSPSSGGGLTP